MRPFRNFARIMCILSTGLILCAALTGCLVGGYSSGSGFFIWPGSILLTLIALVIIFVMRR